MVPSRPIGVAPAWETSVLEAVGRIIDYWGFKRNHGRVWALLYLRDESQDAATIGRRLGLSKGAVSMVLRELEGWAVIRRVPVRSRSGVAYVAERDLWLMLETVLRQRESRLFDQVREDLARAEEEASADTELSPSERRTVTANIKSMRRLADAAHATLQTFMRSRRLDLASLSDILKRPLRR
jgi:DNA-binding transcriptional regulator GbsR (MarR family)